MSEIDEGTEEVITEADVETVEATVEEDAEKAAAEALEKAIKTAFEDSLEEADATEDDAKLAMIGAGATFKNVTRLYNQFMVDAGLALSKEDKATHVTEALEGLEFEDEEGYDGAVAKLISEEKGINVRSAGALLRAYAKKNELEVFKKPKAEGVGKTGFAAYFYDLLRENPFMTKEEATLKIQKNPSNSENVRRHESHYLNIQKLVLDVSNSLIEPSAEEVEEHFEDEAEETNE